MPPNDLDKFSRTISYEGQDIVIERPGIAIVLYSVADITTVMHAAADLLIAYLDFVPANALQSSYKPGPDEYTPGQWVPFDSVEQDRLLSELRSAAWSSQQEGYGCVLSGTPNGQAGDYGLRIGAIDLAAENEGGNELQQNNNETSLLRLELPWNLLEKVDVATLVDFVETKVAQFPFCSGHVGMSFIHTIAYLPEARSEIQRLLPRLLGFDSAYDTAQLEMRGKSPPAHWLNLLDDNLVRKLGGEQKLRFTLEGAKLRRIGRGLLIEAAKYPPVVDVNRGGTDIGCLPTVARALKPVRFDEASFVGLPDELSGRAWLDRFDNLTSRDWDNT